MKLFTNAKKQENNKKVRCPQMDIGMEIDRIKTDRDRFTEGRTNILVNYVRGCKTWTMEVVRRSRNNAEKQPCFGN